MFMKMEAEERDGNADQEDQDQQEAPSSANN